MAQEPTPVANPPRCADLLRALENARSRFVVAVASESKTTSLDRRTQYMAMEKRLRLHLSQLRRLKREPRGGRASWVRALEQLTVLITGEAPSPHAIAETLCRKIGDILLELEMTPIGWDEAFMALGPVENGDIAGDLEQDSLFSR